MQTVSGYIINIPGQEIFPGIVEFDRGKITGISRTKKAADQYILPGFIDAHVHIESSMLPPAEFARLAVSHGTVATVSDPHEIANVLGIEGVRYMINNGEKVNFKFYFGAPSCVPATPFESAGAKLGTEEIEELFKSNKVKYLAEMMNWPGVLNNDPEVYQKIELAKKYQLPVDGHAPGLQGEQAIQYINAGISTDHESFKVEEAIHKLKNGMKIIIREGSAAQNFEELHGLIYTYPEQIMFCSDDKHPDSLVEGHINQLVKRSIAKGIDIFKVLQAACLNPIDHYNLDVGKVREGDPADFIVVNSIIAFDVVETYINGQKMAENGQSSIRRIKSMPVNNFNTPKKDPSDFTVNDAGGNELTVMVAQDKQLITEKEIVKPALKNSIVIADPDRDILKITVVNRYSDSKPAVAFIKNFGLKKGAIASSVAHDSHNIIAVGVNDEMISKSVNLIIENKGGICAVTESQTEILPLPIAGLMSDEDGYHVSEKYAYLDQMAKNMGSRLTSPFMTLSFMALLVIPKMKLSDKGLFDGEKFEFVNLQRNT